VLNSGLTSPLPPRTLADNPLVTLTNTSHFSKLPPTLPSFDWNSVLKALDLFYRERQVRVTQTVAQLRGVAADDEIIKTMMENEETRGYADQRIHEIIRDGIALDQEVVIEQLHKQVIVAKMQSQQATSLKEHMLGEITRYQ
jgi:hypothetical protein